MDFEIKTIGAQVIDFALCGPADVLGDIGLDSQDPAIVIKSAISNAISLAGIILTANGVILIPEEIKEAEKGIAIARRMQIR